MSMKPISTGCLRKNAKTDEVKGNEKSVQTTLYRMAVPMGRCASLRTGIEGTTGLLHAPSAEMQRDKTFMFGGNILDIIPLHYYDFDVKYTFNYYINITFFPWLEVGYTCTLNYANEGSTYFPEESWGKYTNQDRSFNFRLRVWKEGWWKSWTPQIVLGADDPGTHDNYGGGGISNRDQNGGNCFLPVII